MSDMSQKPSREIDELIADKVMGLKRKSRIHGTTDEVDIYTANPYFFDSVRKEDLHYVAPLPYSTNIAAAWEVVNHLMCLGYDNKWFFQLHYDNVELWDASFYKESTSDGGGPEVWSTAGAPALAICLAALKAINQEGQG